MDSYYTDIPTDFSMDSSVAGVLLAAFGMWTLFICLIAIFKVIYTWKIYVKAGKPGWASLIPIYNVYVKLQFLNMPWWFLLLLLVPALNFAIIVLMDINMAKKFGKDIGFAIGLILLPIIFMPILAFGKSTYNPMIKGVLEDEFESSTNNQGMNYCPNCGNKVSGKYCSNCGEKI